MASQDPRAPAVLVFETLAVAACYYAAGRLGLMLNLVVDGSVVSPFWPPTGVAVACLLRLGLRCWAGIALGSLFVLLSLDASPQWSTLGLLAGSTAAPVCGYLLLRRVGFRNDLARLRDGLALVFLGALGAMLISSSVATGLLVATGDLPARDFWTVWLIWWVGDAMGVLIVTPVLLLVRRVHLAARWPRLLEAAGLAVAAGCVVPLATHHHTGLLFLVYPLLIWAALRFQLTGSALCALVASVLATVAAIRHIGSFGRLTETEIMVKLQLFNGTMALTALLLSAVITEQRNTRRSVESACQELAEVLEHLTAGDAASGRAQPDQEARRRTGDG